MKIIVLSDTHIPVCADRLPQKVYDYIKKSDLVVHAGDVTEKFFLDKLILLKEVKVVCGNMDSPELQECLPKKLVFTAGGKKIGVAHGCGCKSDVLKNIITTFKEKLDIVVFGHSHNATNEEIDGTIYFNPGSATDMVSTGKCSFGVIEINGDEVSIKIIEC